MKNLIKLQKGDRNMDMLEIIYNFLAVAFCAVLIWGTLKISKGFTAEEKKH